MRSFELERACPFLEELSSLSLQDNGKPREIAEANDIKAAVSHIRCESTA